MPKIAEIEPTPNPNAMKFVLKDPLTWGVSRSYENAEQAKDDPLASALFDIEHVTSIFYVDHWITVTQDGQADWQELMRQVAGPIREAPSADADSAKYAQQAAGPREPPSCPRPTASGWRRSTISWTSRCGPTCRATAGISMSSGWKVTASWCITRAP